MKKRICYILFIFTALMSSGITVSAQQNAPKAPIVKESNIFDDNIKAYYSQVLGISMPVVFNTELYSTIEDWLGTPYRYAGKTLGGIDCSGFVNKIYEKAYCYLLTGTSADLFKQVTLLPKDKLEEGDLVFFKINHKSISHVGVYLGNDKFAHASCTNGVIISDLNEPYYKKYFVKGGRVHFNVN